MLISQTIRNLLNGVSQQPKALRLSSQGAVQQNALSSYVHGLRKRPPTKHIAKLTATTAGYPDAFIHDVNRAPDDRYTVVVANGDVQVYDALTGGAKTIVSPHGTDYLTGAAGFRAVTVGDYTFLINRGVVVKQGTTKAPAQPPEALIYVRQADFSTDYSVTINGKTVSVRTVDAAHASSRAQINTTNIAADLLTALNAEPSIRLEGFYFTQYGSSIYVARLFDHDFTLTSTDGMADKGLKIIKGTVQAFDELPARAKGGMVVQITGDPESGKDNYWVQYDDTAADGQNGVWRECPAPGTLLDLDASTMPWALVRRGDILSDATHSGPPPAPTIKVGEDITWSDTYSADTTGTLVDPTADLPITDHGGGFIVTPSSTDGTTRNFRAFYDVDTTLVEPGIHTEARLSKDVGNGWEPVRSHFYAPGHLSLGERFDEPLVMPAGTKLKVELFYTTQGDPASIYRQSTILLHGADHPETPGVLTVVTHSRDVVFDAAQVYPVGSTITVTVESMDYTYAVGGADETGATVATALANLIQAGGAYGATNPASGTIRITHGAFVAAPDVSVDVTMDPTVFWHAGLNMVANEHVGRTLKNVTDGSSGTVTANTANTVSVDALTGGADNSFHPGDLCTIVGTGEYFVFDRVPWKARAAGDLDLVPFPSFIGKSVSEVFFYQNRLGVTSDENVVLSASGDLFNWFRQTATQLLDDDVIDVKSALKDVALLDSAVEWNDALYLFSSSGHQLALSGDPVLAPRTVRLDHVTSFPVSPDARPVVLGSRVFFAHETSGYTQVIDYAISPITYKPDGTDITKHVPKYLAGAPKVLAGDAHQEFLCVVTDAGVYAFVYHENDGRRVLASWSEWTFGGTVLSAAMYDGVLSLLILRADGVYLETMDVAHPPDANGDHRDRQGSGSEETYTFRYQFSPIYMRDQQDAPDTGGRLQLRYGRLAYQDARSFTVTVTPTGRPAKSYAFSAAAPAEGVFPFPILCRNTDVIVEIADSSVLGCAFSELEWEGWYTLRSKRV